MITGILLTIIFCFAFMLKRATDRINYLNDMQDYMYNLGYEDCKSENNIKDYEWDEDSIS